MHFSSTLSCLGLLAAPSLAYSAASSSALEHLASSINQTTGWINHLEGCGYKSTTQAISAGASATSGSACPAADNAIASRLSSVSSSINSAVTALTASRSSSEISSSQIVSTFDDFAMAFYSLFNAMDLAECTYILTTSSKSFAIQFSGSSSSGDLKDGFNALVAELSTEPAIGLRIAATNLKQQTHFGGTSLLATSVGGPKDIALTGCNLITGIVESEGGGSS